MSITRRDLMTATAIGSTVALLTGCKSLEQMATPVGVTSDQTVAKPRISEEAAATVLGRSGYGHRPGDRTLVMTTGASDYVDSQLAPDQITEDEVLTVRLRGLSDMVPDDYGLLFEQDDHVLMTSLAQTTLLRAVYSKRQLEQRMVEFWSDHFNVFAFKTIKLPQYVALYHLHVLRRHALSSFRDLLGASAHSGAILCYLDNTLNAAGRPNENYARELMELHTLGIHGGYTQHDVREVARCLTGWTVDEGFKPGSFLFKEIIHDQADKLVLGKTIRGGGQHEMERVLDMLAFHPATAKHIATKLLARFRGDALPEHIDHVSNTFAASSGNIKKTVRAVLIDCGVVDAPPILKRPFDYVASALRAIAADSDCGSAVIERLSNMGQAPFQWPRPDGYPDSSKSWANCMSARWQFAMDLCAGDLANTSVDWKSLAPDSSHLALYRRVFSCPQMPRTLSAVRNTQNGARSVQEFASLLLMSPEFQWR